MSGPGRCPMAIHDPRFFSKTENKATDGAGPRAGPAGSGQRRGCCAPEDPRSRCGPRGWAAAAAGAGERSARRNRACGPWAALSAPAPARLGAARPGMRGELGCSAGEPGGEPSPHARGLDLGVYGEASPSVSKPMAPNSVRSREPT